MDLMHTIGGIRGGLLVAVLCGLLFVEECGVPLLFAPGDVVIAVGGIASSCGAVNPFALSAALLVAIVTGGMLGREIFAGLGRQAALALADRLHVRRSVDRTASVLERGGPWMVFVSRLMPGLRIFSTQVAGISGISRRTYLAGLAPSAIVYVTVVFGLGWWLGPPLLTFFGHAAAVTVWLALGLAAAAGGALLVRKSGVVRRQSVSESQMAALLGPLEEGVRP